MLNSKDGRGGGGGQGGKEEITVQKEEETYTLSHKSIVCLCQYLGHSISGYEVMI